MSVVDGEKGGKKERDKRAANQVVNQDMDIRQGHVRNVVREREKEAT